MTSIIRARDDDLNDTSEGTKTSSASAAASNSMSSSGRNDERFSANWTRIIATTHKPIMRYFLQPVTRLSAHNPKSTIAGVALLSLLLITVGFFTNFNVDVDKDVLWTPAGSYPAQHRNWILTESDFPREARFLAMFFHSDGANVLGRKQVSRVFDALDTVRNVPGYDAVCTDEVTTCQITGVVRFWNSSATAYEASVESDADAVAGMSSLVYPDGVPVPENQIFGYPERDPVSGFLMSAISYTVVLWLPHTGNTKQLERDAVHALLDLNEEWVAADAGDGNPASTLFRIETQAESSFEDEFTRAIAEDIPLVPIVFATMAAFTCSIFFRKNRVRSRCLLGVGAVVAVLLSIISGFGLLFIAAVPFTSMTQITPFVTFGVGLDDAFIIMGSYSRTDHSKDPVDRIADAIGDAGLSITLTTITSASAFGLGCISKVPAVYWLCLYLCPTIILVLLFQLTFFVACIVLDERRIIDRRRDCCVCLAASKELQEEDTDEDQVPGAHISERIMAWYAERLLNPAVRLLVMLVFAALVCVAGWRASLLTQEFKFTDVIPSDSFITDYVDATDNYRATTNLPLGVYFRFVDQSDVLIQAQMRSYVSALVAMDSIEDPPNYFWLRDFHTFVNQTDEFVGTPSDLDFKDQIALFLAQPVFYNLYHEHIVLDGGGNVIESRTFVIMDNIDFDDVNQQIDAIAEQRAVTRAQPINQGRDEFAFFTYEWQYNMWEFYSTAVEELIQTTIIGVVVVTGVALLFIPHWSAALFVLPLICILYVDLLGVLQLAGIHINAVSYVALVMSIGLLVDFILHPLLRYYECLGNRREKVVEMLKTMGASILLGGMSTFLGTLPLAFSSSHVFNTIFIAFFGIVTLGMGHGLILLPVLLATFGPGDQISEDERVTRRNHQQFLSYHHTEISNLGDRSYQAAEFIRRTYPRFLEEVRCIATEELLQSALNTNHLGELVLANLETKVGESSMRKAKYEVVEL